MHEVVNVDIFAVLKFEEKSDKEINCFNFQLKYQE